MFAWKRFYREWHQQEEMSHWMCRSVFLLNDAWLSDGSGKKSLPRLIIMYRVTLYRGTLFR
jgi:hypothetical protein